MKKCKSYMVFLCTLELLHETEVDYELKSTICFEAWETLILLIHSRDLSFRSVCLFVCLFSSMFKIACMLLLLENVLQKINCSELHACFSR